jgi:type VI secretion system protein ImpB
MAKEGTVAPKERVNIRYKPASSELKEGVEIPLKLLVLADLTGRPDERPVEERAPVSIDKDNFARVMAEQKICVQVEVADHLRPQAGGELSIALKVRGLSDLSPDGVAAQVPELQKLLALRSALIALKGPMGNIPAFRRKIQALLGDDGARKRLRSELGVEALGAGASGPSADES